MELKGTLKRIDGTLPLFVSLVLPALLLASPVGRWTTIDEKTGEPKAIVEIYEKDGVLEGKIVRSVKDTVPDKPEVCDKCVGKYHNKSLRGVQFIWDMKPDGSKWSGGRILDPKTEKIYKAKMKLADGGKKLEVRGFIGISLLGRTQVWETVE